MVDGCDGLMGDHGSWVKVTLLPVEKKAAGVVKLTSACRGLGRVEGDDVEGGNESGEFPDVGEVFELPPDDN